MWTNTIISVQKQNNGVHMLWTQLGMVLKIRMVIQGILLVFIWYYWVPKVIKVKLTVSGVEPSEICLSHLFS